MRRTIHDQIAANGRLSVVYSLLVMLVLTGLGASIVGYYAPQYWIGGAAGCAVLGIIVALVAWNTGGEIVLRINQARDATPHELQVVNNVVEEMAIAAGIPKPEVYVIDDPAPNAFATGKGPKKGIVCVTTGLLAMLNRDELQGVVGHEVGHIRNNDIRFMTTLAIVVGLIPLISHFFLRSLWYGGGGRRRSDSDSGGQAALIFAALAIVLAILAPICTRLLELAVSRRREFMADASSAQFTRNPGALADALRKISSHPQKMQTANRATAHMFFVNPFKPVQKIASLFSTHPPVEDRIAALMGLNGMDYHRYLPADDQDAL
ncbi:MAG TPA: M48 family metallopeptidase [Fimbriimonadaceae bacterium]|nr:M48 family metallopeptidase [Fimbriimonadaceae bacterium]